MGRFASAAGTESPPPGHRPGRSSRMQLVLVGSFLFANAGTTATAAAFRPAPLLQKPRGGAKIGVPYDPVPILQRQPQPQRQRQRQPQQPQPQPQTLRPSTSTARRSATAPSPLFASAAATAIASRSCASFLPVLKRIGWAVLAACLVFFRDRILWPGAPPADEPGNGGTVPSELPPGVVGCPFVGTDIFKGTSWYGPGIALARISRRLLPSESNGNGAGGNGVFRFYAFGQHFVSVSGRENIQSVVTRNEFRPTAAAAAATANGDEDPGRNVVATSLASHFPNALELFGNRSVLYENRKRQHSLLRQLVGNTSMSPAALSRAVPAVQRSATRSVVDGVVPPKGSSSPTPTSNAWQVCNDYTLDVAWRQILGLNLQSPDEIAEFKRQVQTWIGGMMSPIVYLPFRFPFLRYTRAYKAKEYVRNLIEDKLNELDRSGPDGSTLSNIYFATIDDEEEEGTDGATEASSSTATAAAAAAAARKRLTREEVVQNAMILIVAGSETSASTLTNAVLLLGLHKGALKELQQEQERFLADKEDGRYTRDELDAECPYLDAFIKETLRIRPIPTFEVREVGQTIYVPKQRERQQQGREREGGRSTAGDSEYYQIPKGYSIWTNVRATHDNDPICRRPSGSTNDTDDDDEDLEHSLEHMDIVKGFRPERWLSPSTRPSKEYIPFGDGAHRCLGEKLAMLEMKVFLATFVRHVRDFDVLGIGGGGGGDEKDGDSSSSPPYPKIEWKGFSAIPRPKDGVNIRVTQTAPDTTAAATAATTTGKNIAT